MSMTKTRTIKITERGNSEIAAVNGDSGDGVNSVVGQFGDKLKEGDRVELEDGSVWMVKDPGTRILIGAAGEQNYVWAELESAPE